MLICNSLSNLKIYLMSLFFMLKELAKRLEAIQSDFLWDGRALKDKTSLVKLNWDSANEI